MRKRMLCGLFSLVFAMPSRRQTLTDCSVKGFVPIWQTRCIVWEDDAFLLPYIKGTFKHGTGYSWQYPKEHSRKRKVPLEGIRRDAQGCNLRLLTKPKDSLKGNRHKAFCCNVPLDETRRNAQGRELSSLTSPIGLYKVGFAFPVTRGWVSWILAIFAVPHQDDFARWN